MIAPELGDCVNLVYIDLSGLGLHGTIPSSLGRLTRLKCLYRTTLAERGCVPLRSRLQRPGRGLDV